MWEHRCGNSVGTDENTLFLRCQSLDPLFWEGLTEHTSISGAHAWELCWNAHLYVTPYNLRAHLRYTLQLIPIPLRYTLQLLSPFRILNPEFEKQRTCRARWQLRCAVRGYTNSEPEDERKAHSLNPTHDLNMVRM